MRIQDFENMCLRGKTGGIRAKVRRQSTKYLDSFVTVSVPCVDNGKQDVDDMSHI